MNDGGVSTATSTVPPSRSAWRETLHRVGLYTLRRVAVLLGTVVIGTYLAVLIANWGGEVDKMREAQCKERAGMSLQADPALQFSPEERRRRYEQEVERCKQLQGLDRPFLARSLEYLRDALTLSLGRAMQLTSDSGSREVRNIILERLPATLLLFGTADLVLFFTAISIALFLSRRYGSVFDRMIRGASAYLHRAGMVLWHLFNSSLCGSAAPPAVRRHGGHPATDIHGGIRRQRAAPPHPARGRSGDRLHLPVDLFLENFFQSTRVKTTWKWPKPKACHRA